MVHIQRLISVTMIIYSCAVTVLNICTLCLAQADVNNNIIRDPVQLSNSYQAMNSRETLGNNEAILAKSIHQPRLPLPYTRSRPETQVTREENLSLGWAESEENANSMPDNHEEAECPLCAAARKNARLDDETLRAVRVEFVKQQILKKLRLKEPPKISNFPKGHNPLILPPIALGNPLLTDNNVRSEHDDDVANIDLEDFYGKPEQTIVLPEDELSDCSSWSTNTPLSEAASCFVFKLPKEVRLNRISSAELWVYVRGRDQVTTEGYDADNTDNVRHHNFSISEMMTVSNYRTSSSNKRSGSRHFNTMVDRNDVPETAGWVNFNITHRAGKWLEMDLHEHTLKISCSSCSLEAHDFPFDNAGEQQPFIVFNIASGKKGRRHRRSLNCSPGITECCRESLYISFEEIKWDWVVEPKGFDAYYCKGKCHGDTALAHTTTHHSGIMLEVIKSKGGVSNKTEELVPCCTATEMSSISMIYRDPQSYNTTFQHVKLPNMVVQSCGCK